MPSDEELAAALAALLEEGREDKAAELVVEVLRGEHPDLSDEDRERIAAEVSSWLIEG